MAAVGQAPMAAFGEEQKSPNRQQLGGNLNGGFQLRAPAMRPMLIDKDGLNALVWESPLYAARMIRLINP